MMMIPSILYLLEYCEIRKILNLFKTIGVVLSIFAIYEVFSGSYIIQNEYLGIMYNGSRVIRAMVFSGSFLTFGTIMAMISVVSFYDFYTNTSKLNLICLIINVVGLLMSSSRGPLVAFVISAIVIYVYIGGRVNLLKVFKVILIMFIIGMLLAILGTTLSRNNSTIAFYLNRLQSIFDWSENSASNTGRIDCWLYSIPNFVSQKLKEHKYIMQYRSKPSFICVFLIIKYLQSNFISLNNRKYPLSKIYSGHNILYMGKQGKPELHFWFSCFPPFL